MNSNWQFRDSKLKHINFKLAIRNFCTNLWAFAQLVSFEESNQFAGGQWEATRKMRTILFF
jgi:hypothetical protein